MTPLGDELRNVRKRLGLSLKDHAHRIGISPAYLSALEHGYRSVPTDEMLERIISTLELDAELTELLRRLREVSRPDVTVRTGGLSPTATELANLLARNIHLLSIDELSECLEMLRRKAGRVGRSAATPPTAHYG